MIDFTIKHGETTLPIVADLSDAITAAGFTATTDIIAMTFMLKDTPTDTDVAALYTGTLAGGQITLDATELTASIVIDDFSGLVAGECYYMALGIQFTGDAGFREPDLEDNRGKDVVRVQITQDVIRG